MEQVCHIHVCAKCHTEVYEGQLMEKREQIVWKYAEKRVKNEAIKHGVQETTEKE